MLKQTLNRLAALTKDESGAALAEYGMLVALIAVACVIGVGAFGTSLNGFFSGLFVQLGL
jgi:pilus assembly protein Flp/PilA